jgi:hypothetical protein
MSQIQMFSALWCVLMTTTVRPLLSTRIYSCLFKVKAMPTGMLALAYVRASTLHMHSYCQENFRYPRLNFYRTRCGWHFAAASSHVLRVDKMDLGRRSAQGCVCLYLHTVQGLLKRRLRDMISSVLFAVA